MTSKTNIVIFGETGVGKSSLINLLVGSPVAKTSNSAVGCTLTFDPYDSKCGKYRYYDTAGFNEGSAGAVTASEAISNVIKLLKSLRSSGGVHLLIYVIKKGRITKTTEQNYKLFVDTICQKKVPTLLVITNCEVEEKMGNWWLSEKAKFEQTYKMTFQETVSACATNGEGMHPTLKPLMETLYEETFSKLEEARRKHQLQTGWIMQDWITWFSMISVQFVNLFRTSLNYSALAMHEPLKRALVDHGMNDNQAIAMCNEICKATF